MIDFVKMQKLKKFFKWTISACASFLLAFFMVGCAASVVESSSSNTRVESSSMQEAVYVTERTNTGITITSYKGTEKTLIIPQEINGEQVTAIGDKAFAYHATLESVVLPDTVEKIGELSFADCSKLYNITIPNTVNWIGNQAFEGTPWLKEKAEEFVIVGDGVLIKYNGNSYDELIIPEGVHMISDVFAGLHSLRSVSLPNSLRIIGPSAFMQCLDLQDIIFPENLQRIEYAAFQKCTCLESLTFPKSLEAIEAEAFSDCHSLKEVIFTNENLQISLNSFAYTPIWNNLYNEESGIVLPFPYFETLM